MEEDKGYVDTFGEVCAACWYGENKPGWRYCEGCTCNKERSDSAKRDIDEEEVFKFLREMDPELVVSVSCTSTRSQGRSSRVFEVSLYDIDKDRWFVNRSSSLQGSFDATCYDASIKPFGVEQ